MLHRTRYFRHSTFIILQVSHYDNVIVFCPYHKTTAVHQQQNYYCCLPTKSALEQHSILTLFLRSHPLDWQSALLTTTPFRSSHPSMHAPIQGSSSCFQFFPSAATTFVAQRQFSSLALHNTFVTADSYRRLPFCKSLLHLKSFLQQRSFCTTTNKFLDTALPLSHLFPRSATNLQISSFYCASGKFFLLKNYNPEIIQQN
jgi:hypothetical protein